MKGGLIARNHATKPAPVKMPAAVVTNSPVFRTKPVAPKTSVAATLPTVVKPAAVKPGKATTPAKVAKPAPVISKPGRRRLFCCTGDANGDGRVDIADFKIVSDNQGKSGMTLCAGGFEWGWVGELY